MHNLEEFILGTPLALVTTLGSKADEERLISRWAVKPAEGSAPVAHPLLYHVGLYYGGKGPSERFLSHWYRAGGRWRRSIAKKPLLGEDVTI